MNFIENMKYFCVYYYLCAIVCTAVNYFCFVLLIVIDFFLLYINEYVRRVIDHWNCVALLLFCIDLTVLHSPEIISILLLFPLCLYFFIFH